MVLAEALCAMSLVANSIRDGLCCFYQMQNDAKRQETTEQVIRRAVRDELKHEKCDSGANIIQNHNIEQTSLAFSSSTCYDDENKSLLSTFVNEYEVAQSPQHFQQQRSPSSSLLSPIPTNSSLLDDASCSAQTNNYWIHTRDASFVSIRIE